eukprot:CAMPEP_0175074598 /NCGR_PEP_ID=MMETSP0052_2-20121109/21420_1 /TAXON_ID=51329 ORGANISM="Polytomella parva, Strain SAG 63-3" /NCGR_SAMPLE_ID=MMETSP0052_2 /ASSEMBLY_ACC=CAM_ASM_000194 /LENGTH=40 /DNA_ID= /DNA_START= /DNA_END= /DNA_ORIENTATION=
MHMSSASKPTTTVVVLGERDRWAKGGGADKEEKEEKEKEE